MTRPKSDIASRVKKNVPAIWETYPYSAAAIVVGSVLLWELLKFAVGLVF